MNGWDHKHVVERWRKKRIRNWQLILLFILGILTSTLLLRQNKLKMIELRNAVIQADEQNGDVAGALKQLNEHVFNHINTEIVRPIELVHGYNRAAQAVIEAANRGSGKDVYAQATAACERRGVPIASIAQCAAEYALKNNATVDPTKIILPDKNLFTYSFSSPRWTPDAAGVAIVFTGVIGVWLLVRMIEYVAVRIVIRQRLRDGLI